MNDVRRQAIENFFPKPYRPEGTYKGKCLICEVRPNHNGSPYCSNCLAKIDSERNRRTKKAPYYYLTYKGHVVGLYSDGDSKLVAQLETRSAERLPKDRTINLNQWCEGYDKAMIKAFKRCVLRLAHA